MRRRTSSLLVASLLTGACTHLPARTQRDEERPRTIVTSIDRITNDAAHRREVGASTLELHEGADAARGDNDFVVGFVEFDDQGWFHNEAQFDTVKREVEALLLPQDGAPRPAILVGFIHGWRHSAAVCDRDVTCFREVLRGLSVYEAERAAICAKYLGDGDASCERRMIVGVMVGWRGGPVAPGPLEKLNVLTFYSRKSAAHTIGGSGYVASVVGWLNSLDRKLPAKSRLVLAGHSFGGAMLFSSVSGVLNEQIAEERFEPGRDLTDCQSFHPAGVGDLIVLLNPAFETLLYDSIDDRTRGLRDCKAPRTILATLASTSDVYNRVWFKFGRLLSTAFNRFSVARQRVETRSALGHYPPFLTHELRPNGTGQQVLFDDRLRRRPVCACQYETDEEAMRTLARAIYGERRAGAEPAAAVYAQVALPGTGCATPSCLTPVNDSEVHNPFKVVAVDPAIIDGHSDIYNPRLIDFLVRAVAAADAPREPSR